MKVINDKNFVPTDLRNSILCNFFYKQLLLVLFNIQINCYTRFQTLVTMPPGGRRPNCMIILSMIIGLLENIILFRQIGTKTNTLFGNWNNCNTDQG